jgi:hydroxypyruvate reductase
MLRRSPGSLDVWTGEATVRLPPTSGRGGRNQHLALLAARLLDGHPDVALLAAGTDGVDGNSEDAGALVDGATLGRGRELGLDADASLAAAGSGDYLEACGALVYTGPTLTNVGDLVLACRTRRAS